MKFKFLKNSLGLIVLISFQSINIQCSHAAGIFPKDIPVSTLNGTNGFTIAGTQAQIDTPWQSGGYLGGAVSDAGDINGDGRADFMVGAPHMLDSSGSIYVGQAYAFFGTNQFPPFFYSSALFNQNPIKGISLLGDIIATPPLGYSIDNLGDVNGDGIDDIIMGGPATYLDSGRAYVLFGTKTGFPLNSIIVNDIYLNNLGIGFQINGKLGDQLGRSVSGAGDVNGDGINDIIIGAPHPNTLLTFPPLPKTEGHCYVIYGSKNPFPNPFDVAFLNGINGFQIDDEPLKNNIQTHSFGVSASSAGDFNSDGIDDLLIGAPNARGSNIYNSGRTYLIYGKKGGLSHPFKVSMLNGTNGVVINGIATNHALGVSVSDLGDVNGDGRDDIIIGSRINSSSNPNLIDTNEFGAYVIYGRSKPFTNGIFSPSLNYLNGLNGFLIHGKKTVTINYISSVSVGAAGDVNGDDLNDIIIGDESRSQWKGEGYVIFGRPNTSPHFYVTNLNGSNGFSISPKIGGQLGHSVSGAGDINGDGVDDIIIGAPYAGTGSSIVPIQTYAGESYVIYGKKAEYPWWWPW